MDRIARIRQMTPHDLAVLGLQGVAYIRTIEAEGRDGYMIHAADGTEIGVAQSRELAIATDPAERPGARQPALSPWL